RAHPLIRSTMPIGLLQMLSAGVMASLLMGPAAWLARADLQTVTVIVERADGTYQPDLTRDDIAVVVEGQPRPVESVTPVEAPLTLLVILDVTMSVHPLEALGSPSY